MSASTGRNDFIFDIWLWHGDLYRVSPFQIYRTSTSCLLCDLNERVGVFLARCSVQHLVVLVIIIVVHCLHYILVMHYWNLPLKSELERYMWQGYLIQLYVVYFATDFKHMIVFPTIIWFAHR
jgi:hypothetical protein